MNGWSMIEMCRPSRGRRREGWTVRPSWALPPVKRRITASLSFFSLAPQKRSADHPDACVLSFVLLRAEFLTPLSQASAVTIAVPFDTGLEGDFDFIPERFFRLTSSQPPLSLLFSISSSAASESLR